MIALEDIMLRQGAFSLELSLSIAAGRRVAVIGKSGAGKSSLLNLIAGFQTPDAGQVMIDGQDVTHAPVAQRPLSILFQDGNLFPHLTAFDNVALGLRPDLRLNAEDRGAVEESLRQVGLEGLGNRKPSALSGGQAARVGLARMLLRDRPVALMDEPFAALDPGLRREMAGLVAELCATRGMTLVLVAHEIRGLEGLADELCLLEEGRVVLRGETRALLSDPPVDLNPWL